MKKYITLLVLLFFGWAVYGKRINENTARTVGRNFLTSKTNSPTLKNVANLPLVYKSCISTTTYFYIFNAGSVGYVIVAGDDNATPILGYSDQGVFDPNNVPKNVTKWLEGYKDQIRYIIDHQIPTNDEILEEWQNLKNGKSNYSNAKVGAVASVNPLLQTHWDQSPYYNALCPGGSVTGCVATATAQIMKYWNYPTTGSGFHSFQSQDYGTLSANFGSTTYQWGLMPNTVSSSNTAVATLMYQVGVSLNMEYSPQESSAYVISAQSPITNCAEYALKTYFGYKNTLQGIQRSSYTDVQWFNLLKTELDANRPVLYAGFGSAGGHCFVADGYNNSNYLHINWGWGGNSDGYFQINALNPAALGTGGGSGGFNSGQQAVIGVEPPTVTQPYDMALYDYVTPSASTITYGQAFTINTNIVNNGTNNFSGDYTAAIFDNANNFVDYVQILSTYNLQAGYSYASNLVFSTAGLYSMLPGSYYADIFYRPTGGNWGQVTNNGGYTNKIPITVVYSNSIELYSAVSITPGTTLIQGQAASVNLNILNNGTTTFIGKYAMNLYNLDGSFAQAMGTYTESTGLPAGYDYIAPFLTFNSASVTVTPGTYLLAVEHNPNNTGWKLTGSTYYQNPIKVTVVAPDLLPDSYEVNNSISQSYNLPIPFTGNSATATTTGSNCHITSDNDYYQVALPPGYDYVLTPRLHDSYNSGNGNTYTLDALFSYSLDGSNWSDVYDDALSWDIIVNYEGTVYFHVAPYFAGETGTYLLEIPITRTAATSVAEKEPGALIKIYPTPSKDFITVDLTNYTDKINQLNLLNVQGQQMLSLNSTNIEKTLSLSLTSFPDGIYFLQFQTDSGTVTKKIIIGK
jgi:hypothetical protein